MWRRAGYVFIGIVALNLLLMAAMFVRAQDADTCDTSARGLVIRDEDDDRWIQAALPAEPTDLPPCRGRHVTELEVTAY